MRLFISIPINEHLTDKLVQNLGPVRQSLKGRDIRYQPPYKWHFTIIFLGDQPERDIRVIKQGVSDIAEATEPPEVIIKNIRYGPNNKNPRMIWATTDPKTSKRLGDIRKKLRTKLDSLEIEWKKSKWRYRGHITLARFEPDKLKNPPDIKVDTHLEFKPKKIELKKSILSPQGAEYSTLHEARFSTNS